MSPSCKNESFFERRSYLAMLRVVGLARGFCPCLSLCETPVRYPDHKPCIAFGLGVSKTGISSLSSLQKGGLMFSLGCFSDYIQLQILAERHLSSFGNESARVLEI